MLKEGEGEGFGHGVLSCLVRFWLAGVGFVHHHLVHQRHHQPVYQHGTSSASLSASIPETSSASVSASSPGTSSASLSASSPLKPSPSLSTSSPSLIAYVHNVSPPKRNRNDTMNYCSFNLQTSNEDQEALCFSNAKRMLLVESEKNRRAIKLTQLAKTSDNKKIIVNDMTKIQSAEQSEYSFQYRDSPSLTSNKPTDLKRIAEHSDEFDTVSVSVKLVHLEPPRTVGQKKLRLAKAAVKDLSDIMELELWENLIDKVQTGNTYLIHNLSVRLRRGKKVLGTTKSTIIRATNDQQLLHLSNDDATNISSSKTITVEQFDNVDRVEKFKKFVKCHKKVIQIAYTLTTQCDHCKRTIRTADCRDGIWAKVSFTAADGEPVTLVMFEEIITTHFTNTQEDIDIQSLSQTLLSLKNINITFDDNNIVTDLNFSPA
ncbi:hypothetical protein OS493_007003 [Desmophyllum pertusum]|uniref:Uncharacterized protein n=1 Tax=Desmophyllum pertusum TaxID=174260 RepID=A0A9X0CZZ3_9CNID|nr:hypothetical protein OS493_007003 [Desmophyllum pertusum]